MPLMSWLNLIISITMVLVSYYLLFRGRKVYRGLIFWNFIVALQFLTVYLIVVEDSLFIDILDWQDITCYLIRPLIFSLGLMLTVNIYFLGKRHDV